MAHIYPEQLSDDSTSEAERRVLAALRLLGPEYTAICQLAWLTPDPAGRPYEGEADVVIAHPEWGVQVLEVKGGAIQVEPARGWTSNGHSIRDPVAQARRAAHELARRLRSAPTTRSYAYPFGYGIWLPDADAARVPSRPDAPDSIVLDAADLQHPVEAVERLYSFWLPDPLPTAPGAEGIAALVRLLAPLWAAGPLLGRAIAREQAEQRRLTDQQLSVLKMLRRRPRALVAGGAGSGKTLLAAEKARALAGDGFSVLFTCFNKNLAAALKSSLQGSGVTVTHFHELCYRLGREAGVDLPDEDSPGVDDRYFNERLPEALAQAVAALGPQYDAIVVDEGQDFLEVWWVPLTDLLRDRQLGVLYIFFDDHQDIYRRASAWPITDEPFELATNCRSTKAIHRVLQRTIPGALDDVDCIGPEGRAIERVQLDDEEPESKALRRVLHRLIAEERVSPSDVVVLTPRSQIRSTWREGTRLGNFELTWGLPASTQVQVSTIHSFKGLERPVVVLTELHYLHSGHEQELLYVARSRATNHLVELWSTK